jgi:hypothetical protein
MKKIALFVITSGWLALRSAQAFNPQPDPPRYGMIGVTPGETLRINVANPELPSATLFAPPCRVELAFLDSTGSPLLPAVQKALEAGQSAHFDLNGDELFSRGTGDVLLRAEVRPVVRVLSNAAAVGSAFIPPGPCVSSIELFDNATSKTLVTSGPQNPGVIAGFNPQPDPPKIFGQLGLVAGQTIRLNAANVLDPGTTLLPPDPCRVTLVFFGQDGNILAHTTEVLQPGAATFLDFALPTINSIRTEVRADVTVESLSTRLAPPDPCRATLEVFDNDTGRTTAIQLSQVPQRAAFPADTRLMETTASPSPQPQQ